ncbi:MAG: hypothetical protein KKD18_04965 [Nanoarchaeota archaeon]|nr:hypothetical protein [Nanoarchaeota archaeon]MBU0977742.1 hypothetical protein [Nanoarchaeota archaeon]
MRSTLILIIIALILIVPLTDAATTIKGKTLPGRDVAVSIWKDENGPPQYQAPELTRSDIYGIYQYTYDGDKTPFTVLVIIKSFNIQEYRQYFGPFESLGGTIQLPDLLPEGYIDPTQWDDETNDNEDNITNDQDDDITDENNDNLTNENNDNNQETDSDSTIPWFNENTLQILYYILGGIFIVGVIAAIVVFIITKIKNAPKKPIRYGMEPVKLDTKYKGAGNDKYLSKIEEEIDDVERQIEQYKKRNRLEDAERRLEEKKKLLEKLKKGENFGSSKEEREEKYKKKFN